MKRRTFIALIGGAMAPALLRPRQARAQAIRKVWRIGFVAGGTASLIPTLYNGFVLGLRAFGWVEGRNIAITWRFAEGRYERFAEFAAELVRMNVDVIVLATPAAVLAVRQATSTIPIIMGYSTDPVGNGFVASLARPGGNVTGLASSTDDTAPKRLDLLTNVVPNVSRVGYLGNPGTPSHAPVLRNVQAAAASAGLTVVPVLASTPQDVDQAFKALAQADVQALIVSGDAFFFTSMDRIAQYALAYRLPTMFTQREYVVAGGLMSYGENLRDFFGRAAAYVDKIFKGAKPADLPIEQPTYFKWVINRKTADALGIAITPKVEVLADEIIE
jgi:putative ABC transport system substrate-binding protein